jgi:hypothetical protein
MSKTAFTPYVVPQSIGIAGQGDIFLTREGALGDQRQDIRVSPLANGVLGFNSDGALEVTDSPRLRQAATEYTANGAIALTSGTHFISRASGAAMTVAAPTAAIAGTRLTISAGTNFSHVITFTGATLLDGTTGANLTVTLAAFIGSTIVVEARGTNWVLVSSSNVTSITA